MYGYGALSNWSVEEIESALFCLEKAGELKKPRRGFWRGCIRPVSHRVLRFHTFGETFNAEVRGNSEGS